MDLTAERVTGAGRRIAFASLRGELGGTVQKFAVRARFRSEMRVLQCGPKVDGATSLFHLTINKAATQAVRRVLAETALVNGLVPLKLNELAYWTGLPYLDLVEEAGQSNPVGSRLLRRAVHQNGYAYLAVAGPLPWAVGQIALSRCLVVVRDPIALIESDFESVRATHIMPGESKAADFAREREEAAAAGLVTFAVRRLHHYQRMYEWLVQALRTAQVSALLRFEDLLDEPHTELERIHLELGLEAPKDLRGMADEFVLAARGTLAHPKVSGARRERLPKRVRRQILSALEGPLEVLGY